MCIHSRFPIEVLCYVVIIMEELRGKRTPKSGQVRIHELVIPPEKRSSKALHHRKIDIIHLYATRKKRLWSSEELKSTPGCAVPQAQN